MKFYYSLLTCLVLAFGLQAQDKAPENWFNLDANTTKGPVGVGTEQAYSTILKGKTSTTIIVAVIDSGTDYDHEDLKDKIWKNKKEIPGNGIDDDHNGYVDDINGWNFIGGPDGTPVDADNLELTRLVRSYSQKYAYTDGSKLSGSKKKEYDYYVSLKKKLDEKINEAKMGWSSFQPVVDAFPGALAYVKEKAKGEKIDKDFIEKLKKELASDKDNKKKVEIVGRIFSRGGWTEEGANHFVEKVKRYFSAQLDYQLNISFEPRAIVADDYQNSKQRVYGNNNPKVYADHEEHGTHVSGIVGANRANTLGMKGVADNVLIMPIRVVPDGDERDKDVANGIRYAADNGARVINMSFGKGYKYDKKAVDEAVKYAEKKGVLLVHAAGNDNMDIDKEDNYPNNKIDDREDKIHPNIITVGASTWKMGEDITAPFSNYGKKHVDLFAPGYDVYSTVPHNRYDSFNGTSMASPCVAGCAALVLSYYPELSYKQLKDILMKTVTKITWNVKKPGSDEKVPFTDLCVSGGIVNVLEALKEAGKVTGK